MSAAAAPAVAEKLPPYVFTNGDTVHVRHLPNSSPDMVVFNKIMSTADGGRKQLDLVEVYWFNKNHDYCKAAFKYLDLKVVRRANATAV